MTLAEANAVGAVIWGVVLTILGFILILPPRRYHYPIWRMPMGCAMFLVGIVSLLPVLITLSRYVPVLVFKIIGLILGLACSAFILMAVIFIGLILWEYRDYKKESARNKNSGPLNLLDEPETRRNLKLLEKRLRQK